MSEDNVTKDILQESDAQGLESGVELEELKEGEITEPFDPRLIDVTSEVRSLDNLLKRLKIGQIDLDPDFQRSRGIWTPKKKSLLIESLLLRIPLPTFYVSELEAGSELGESRWAVVDGIQRLTTIAEFVDPDALSLSPLRLRGLEYLRDEEGKAFGELPVSLQLRILESQFTIQVIRKSTPEAVKLNIFARINTGGLPLTGQELRNALLPGPSRRLLKEMALRPEFQKAVDFSVRSSRMVDREMALRYLAFRMSDPLKHREADFDSFLRSATQRINGWNESEQIRATDDFARSMSIARDVFGRDAFRKRYTVSDQRRPISKALFEAVSVGITKALDRYGDSAHRHIVNHKAEITKEFRLLMHDSGFERAISQGTGDPARVRLRFALVGELFEKYAQEIDL